MKLFLVAKQVLIRLGIVFIGIVSSTVPIAHAATTTPLAVDPIPAPQQNCWEEASRRYDIDAHLLYAIAKTESNLNSRALSTANAIGLMQIHESWLPTLRQHGISIADLWQPCTNIMVGAWVLASNINEYGRTWEAVGAYNASCRKLKGPACTQARQTYIRQVKLNLKTGGRNA